jgi:hypothetical protein
MVVRECADGLVVAVGAEEPLAEHMMVADFFRKSYSRVGSLLCCVESLLLMLIANTLQTASMV